MILSNSTVLQVDYLARSIWNFIVYSSLDSLESYSCRYFVIKLGLITEGVCYWFCPRSLDTLKTFPIEVWFENQRLKLLCYHDSEDVCICCNFVNLLADSFHFIFQLFDFCNVTCSSLSIVDFLLQLSNLSVVSLQVNFLAQLGFE